MIELVCVHVEMKETILILHLHNVARNNYWRDCFFQLGVAVVKNLRRIKMVTFLGSYSISICIYF